MFFTSASLASLVRLYCREREKSTGSSVSQPAGRGRVTNTGCPTSAAVPGTLHIATTWSRLLLPLLCSCFSSKRRVRLPQRSAHSKPRLSSRHSGCILFVLLFITVLELADSCSHADAGRPSGVVLLLLLAELWSIGGVQVTARISRSPLH